MKVLVKMAGYYVKEYSVDCSNDKIEVSLTTDITEAQEIERSMAEPLAASLKGYTIEKINH